MRRITFNKYAGLRINGKVEPDPRAMVAHIERACWLTAQVESGGNYGTVISYDGTGMTAGLHQAIAVYPKALMKEDGNLKNDQGPLWKLLNRIFSGMPLPGQANNDVCDLLEAIGHAGWYISPDSTVRHLGTGHLVSGNDIRLEFTGSVSGVMPTKGKGRDRATKWAQLFHHAFSHQSTFPIQDAFGAEHIVKRAQRVKLRFAPTVHYRRKTIADIVYSYRNISTTEWTDLGEDVDLAMSVFWSNTVNAPSIALRKICRVIPVHNQNKHEFARELIASLGNAKWGRWDDDIKNGRYQRTRKAAMKIWPKHFFVGSEAIMPKDLPG